MTKHSWGDGATYWNGEQVADIVERLRGGKHSLRLNDEAADEIERLREGLDSYHDELAPLRADNERLRDMLEFIVCKYKRRNHSR